MKTPLLFLIVLLLFACNSPTAKEKQALLSVPKEIKQIDDTAIDEINEFKRYSNGLIYSDQTLSKLTHIVDSLNLTFKSCDLNKRFYSVNQTVGHIVTLQKGNLKSAKRDMRNHISWEDFMKKYPEATIKRDVLILKNKQVNSENKEVVEIKHLDVLNNNRLIIESRDKNIINKDLQNKWVFVHRKKTTYSDEYIEAFYFPNKFTSTELPQKYAQMISYSNCLIDTTTTKFKDKLLEDSFELPENWISLSQNEKVKLLDRMRGMLVSGFCSGDSRPREHAFNIALLSAQTASWKVFLRAHLDIMNDRFDRVSDASDARDQRKTYIKELETLNINVSDLILGISFSMENPAKNHYYGRFDRVGRALTEIKNRAEIEKEMLSIISDTKLDNYNRSLFYLLFLTYNNYISDEKIKMENNKKLELLKNKLPNYIKYQFN